MNILADLAGSVIGGVASEVASNYTDKLKGKILEAVKQGEQSVKDVLDKSVRFSGTGDSSENTSVVQFTPTKKRVRNVPQATPLKKHASALSHLPPLPARKIWQEVHPTYYSGRSRQTRSYKMLQYSQHMERKRGFYRLGLRFRY